MGMNKINCKNSDFDVRKLVKRLDIKKLIGEASEYDKKLSLEAKKRNH